MLRLRVGSLVASLLLLATECHFAHAKAEFSGRVALSTESAGQRFLQVAYDELTSLYNLQSIDDSETRLNGLLDTQLELGRDGGGRLVLDNFLRHGSTLTSDRFAAAYRRESLTGARLALDSETELERGEVFDRKETDLRQTVVARWRKPLGDLSDHIEIYGRGEFRRVTGDTLFFPQSYNLGKAKVIWSRDLGLLSAIDVGYSLQSTAVVDSAPGSYVEHEIAALYDGYSGSSFYVSAEGIAQRRDYIHADSSSATGWMVLSEATVRYSPKLPLDVEVSSSLEWAKHDMPDFVYFDYEKVGLDLGLKAHSVEKIGWEVLPGGELLRAPGSEREDYDQLHLSAGLDIISSWMWLDASYRVGRRDYASPAARDDLQSVPRSDYVFSDLLFLAEKGLWGPLTLRISASHNIEWHELEEDNVTVFFVTSEISYRF